MTDLPDFLPPDLWESWIEYRTTEASRRKFGPVAQKLFLNKCRKLHDEGYDVPALIAHAADVGWLTIWPNDQMKRKQRHRETTVTNLELVETSDKATAAAAINEMRRKAGR